MNTTTNSENSLETQIAPLRDQIDGIDAKLLQLLNERASIAMHIGEIKHQHQSTVFKPERELQVIQSLQEKNQGPLLNASIPNIWREIMSAARMLEQKQSVAFLGPEGTFSQQAMYQYFGHGVQGSTCHSIDEVFQMIDQRRSNFAVVPIENSTEGVVNRSLDLLLHTNANIVGETSVNVKHALLYCLDNLKKAPGNVIICSHAQALAQCQNFLQSHPSLQYCERQAVASNALAAEMAQNNPKYLAIASESCASRYGLHVLERDIQDDFYNRTRFLMMGYHETKATGNDQTSFIIAVPNQPGALLKVLQPLAFYGVSMSRLESRPARKSSSWEYIFMIDLKGHIQDIEVRVALEDIKKHSEFFKLLGSYAIA